jgi:hypothetical protein
MSTNNDNIPAAEQVLLLQKLQALLEKQIELANQSNIKDVESVAEQVDSLVEKIRDGGALKNPKFQNQRLQLQKLYDDLLLALTAQKADTADKLTRLRQTKKVIGSYRSSIRL